jgi:hypothetical protein
MKLSTEEQLHALFGEGQGVERRRQLLSQREEVEQPVPLDKDSLDGEGGQLCQMDHLVDKFI